MLSTRLHILAGQISFINLLLLISTFTFAQTIRYVTPGGTNTNPAIAVSWATSTTDLQGAINASQAGDQVWVAGGTYKPGGNTNTNRSISFSMKNDVAIYGGFTGNETTLSQRPAPNPVNGQPSSSTLSGEIGDLSNATDNSYHVISNPAGLTTTAVLDGFVVTGGNGVGNFPNNSGGGVYNYAAGNGSFCSPTFLNCSFIKNISAFAGGAIYNDGNNAGHCSPILTNCFFTSNSASVGGAMYTRGADNGISNSTLTNCVFKDNAAASQGGAIFNRASTGGTNNYVLTNCTFQSNYAVNSGGAVYNTVESSGISNPVLGSCSFQNNATSSVGGAICNNTYYSNSRPILTNCAFLNNSGQNGGAIYNQSESGNNNSILTNCSFESNSAQSGGGIYNWGRTGNCYNLFINCSLHNNTAVSSGGGAIFSVGSANSTVYSELANSILFGNGGEQTFVNLSATVKATYSLFEPTAHSNVRGVNVTGPGNLTNITTSPFASTTSVALAVCSPALNAGNPASLTVSSGPYSETSLPATDQLNNQRIFGNRVDMGAIEYQQPLPFQPSRLYVKADASGNNTGLDWQNAFNDLQSALTYPCSGSLSEIWVASGIYKPGGNTNTDRAISFSMKNGVAIYGGFVGNETILNQRPVPNPVNGQPSSSTLSGEIGDPNSTTDNSYHVISNPAGLTTTAILDGFVITGGYTEQTTSTVFGNSRGGGVYNAGNNSSPCNPKFISCLFNNNQAFFGGAMYNSLASPLLYNCAFSNNKASYGGAIVNVGTCNPQAINCGFLNNTAANTGGAMFNAAAGGWCRPSLLNCSFQSNLAPTGSVMYNSVDVTGDCITSLTNCIVFNNNGSDDIKNSFAKFIATYSLFEPSAVSNIAGLDLSGPGNLTNITVSPFASTTSVVLAPNSPAINAGDPSTSSATVGITDLAGNPRFVSRIDMGAMEFQGILEMYTLKNGNWNDPSVWSLSRVPQPGERVRLRHTVTIPAGFTASGLILSYDPEGRLTYETAGRLQLGN